MIKNFKRIEDKLINDNLVSSTYVFKSPNNSKKSCLFYSFVKNTFRTFS